MATLKTTLKDKDNNQLLPNTNTECVFDNSGNRLDNILQDLKNADTLDGKHGDDFPLANLALSLKGELPSCDIKEFFKEKEKEGLTAGIYMLVPTNTYTNIPEDIPGVPAYIQVSGYTLTAWRTAREGNTKYYISSNYQSGDGGKIVWNRIYHNQDKPTPAELGDSLAKPQTLALRTSSGDVQARLFRSEYANETGFAGAIPFRVNNGDNNFIRFCSSPAAVRKWMEVISTTGGTITGELVVTNGVKCAANITTTTDARETPSGLSTYIVNSASDNPNSPGSGYATVLNVNGAGYTRQFQLAANNNSTGIFYRSSHNHEGNVSTGYWYPWRKIYTETNLTYGELNPPSSGVNNGDMFVKYRK